MDGLPKIPIWVWVAAGVAVVVLALLARSRGGGSTQPVVVSGGPDADSIRAVEEGQQAQFAQKAGAFSGLVNAIASVAGAEVVGRRDIAVTSLSTSAASYGAAVNARAQQSEQAYGYWGTLARESGETKRAQIAAGTQVTLGQLGYELGIFSAREDNETQRRYIADTNETARYASGQETARNENENRTRLSIATRGYESAEEITAGQQFTDRYTAYQGRPRWYEYAGDILGGIGRLFAGF